MSEPTILSQPSQISDYGKRLLSAVTSLTAEMSRASSKDEVLALVATWLPGIIPADRASVAFPADADHLQVLALQGNKAIPLQMLMPLADTPTGIAFCKMEVITIDDTSKRSDIACRALSGEGLMSCISAPMISQGRPVGTLNAGHWKRGVYTSEHQALLLHVAGVVAAQLSLLERFFATQGRLEVMVAERTAELESQKGQLEAALDKERELNGLQRQFVSMVSHEFRTPLAIIDGNAQRIMRRRDKITVDRLADGLGTIRTSVRRLTDLIESVLGAARLENGGIKFEPEPCDIVEMMQEVCANHLEVSPHHRLITDLDRLPRIVHMDVKLMRQVVSNLVSNAIKYSPQDTCVWIDGDADNDGRVRFSVRDEGPGIPAEECDKLFDRFFRASTSTGVIGTGIGLHIAQVLVDMHGGEVSVSSTEGEGTIFTVDFPALPSSDQPCPNPPSPSSRPGSCPDG